MNPILRNILAVIAGIVVGSVVNMGIVTLSGSIVPLPEGVSFEDPETIKANLEKLSFLHYLFPFLAHAIGTLAGAYTAARLAANNKKTMALIIGFLFLLGGIASYFMIPAPVVFIIADAVLAYIPMALLGYFLSSTNR